MKISTNTIGNISYGLTANDITAIGSEAIADKINSQLGAIEETIDLGVRYEGVIVARVVSCEKHPNADRLNICLLDDSGAIADLNRDENGYVQVVCGAPNVREGLLVAWLPPGSTVPDSVQTEPFVLSARELRGVMSNGMLASAKELALGDSHDGILEIDQNITPGTKFADAFGLANDTVFELENKMFTHRPDCFGFMGVARELAGVQGVSYTSPEWYAQNPEFPRPDGQLLPFEVRNEIPELVPRFSAIVLDNITVGPSPVWLQVELAKVGARPINNIVDYTNYFMLLTGQPLHAYDYDKLLALSDGDPSLVIRKPHTDESVVLLSGKSVQPREDAILIATDQAAVAIGGVMGGANSEVDSTTSRIVLECANFDMYSIRRTSMAHGLFTDAVTRFNKGQSPLQTLAVLSRITTALCEDTGARVASDVIDECHLSQDALDRRSVYAPIDITASFVNARLGFGLSAEDMKQLLENVEFRVSINEDHLTVTAPFWRTDIEIREDIVEEIGRLYGFDKLPLALPHRVITPTAKNPLVEFKTKVRKQLARQGANELLTYSFVPGKQLENAGQNPAQAFKLSNALSPELQYYRLSLTPSLLDKVHPNIKAGHDQFALFELGKAHNLLHIDDDDGLPTEFEMLDLVIATANSVNNPGAPYYTARMYLDELAQHFGISLSYEPIAQSSDYPVAQPYDQARAALVTDANSGLHIGMIGEYTAKTRKAFKLPAECAGFSVSPVHLMQASKQAASSYEPLPKFPKVTQDITLKVNAETKFQDLLHSVEASVAEHQPEHSKAGVALRGIYQKSDDTAFKQITLRLQIANYTRTLTDKEVGNLLDLVTQKARADYGAERI